LCVAKKKSKKHVVFIKIDFLRILYLLLSATNSNNLQFIRNALK
jgi:hypothetical protein